MGSSTSKVRYVSNMGGNILLKAAAVDVAIQWIGFGYSSYMKTEKYYDLTGSSTFLYLTWASLIWAKRRTATPWTTRQIVQNSCVSLWALRLGTYLYSRVLSSGEDRRFTKAKEDPATMFIYWTTQAAWIWISLWPTFIVNSSVARKPLLLRDFVGYSLFGLGFLIETVADYQKKSFRAQPENKDKFITTGLWKYSRHPNYFGEILLWIGLYLPASSVMRGRQWLSILSPVFIAFLITNISGVPLLEKHADQKWAESNEYQQYKEHTAKLIPFVW